MKPNQKVFDHLKTYGYYLPMHLKFVQKLFFEEIVDNLSLTQSFRTSFLSQIQNWFICSS